MKIELMENLNIETDIPILYVERFWFTWKPNCHAVLKLEGYVDRGVQWSPEQSNNTRIKICSEKEKTNVIYHGYLAKVDINIIGNTSRIYLEATSASCSLDWKVESCSFQDISKTYGEVVREMVQADGGQVIRNQKSDKEIEYPVFRHEETTWQFANRMADRIGNYIIPDIETGKANLSFEMRNGKDVEWNLESKCVIQIRCMGKHIGSRFQIEDRTFYKIGDRMNYLGQTVTIVEVAGYFECGELIFKYILENSMLQKSNAKKVGHPAGQGFWGTIKKVKNESVKIALDIDHGKDRGDYYYPWYPVTGNALYAMPEEGARALLYFCCAGEQEGTVIHCQNRDSKEKRCYEDRHFNIKVGNTVDLTRDTICFSRGGNHMLSLDNSIITASTSNGLKIAAEEKIQLKAKQITISSPDELNICQG